MADEEEERCEVPDCAEENFLAIGCDRCERTFCLKHCQYENHNCAKAPPPAAPEQAPAAAAMPAALPTRSSLHAFLVGGVAMMRSDETRGLLRDPALARPGLKLIELQRAGWPRLGIDADVGCSFLDRIDTTFAGDAELIGARNEFVITAQRTYLTSLEDRRPEKLETKLKMPRAVMIEFFDACNTKMDLPETKKRLASYLAERSKFPNELIIEIQKDLLEVMGVEREHGCTCLSAIPVDHPADAELHQRFEMWRQKAANTCMAVVKAHQAAGGALPQQKGVEASPHMRELQAEAKAEIERMTPVERGEMLLKFQKKIEVFTKLPPEGRQSYMEKLSKPERLEFVKAQILLMSLMHQEMRTKQASSSPGAVAPAQEEIASTAIPAQCAGPPAQQQMM